jgi:starch phosphorylase
LPEILPERISRLDELAHNMWWSWHQEARDVFRALDYPLWKSTIHNPVKQLKETSIENLRVCAEDPAFLNKYHSVLSNFDEDLNSGNKWFNNTYPDWRSGPIAFFSMEFAIHKSLPIYAGGLGILAGDICKEASDLGIPLVGIGFMYPQGYFQQRITADGWQEEERYHVDFDEIPVRPVYASDGRRLIIEVELENRSVLIQIWEVRVGRTVLFLLDTEVNGNSSHDCELASRLYIADQVLRLQQEIVLGIGGVRVLRALGIEPVVWHANEGHTALMMLERIREYIEGGASFEVALEKVRTTTIFTTHTPVASGHDTFPATLVKDCFQGYGDSLNVNIDALIRLGQENGRADEHFNMTVLGMRLAGLRNGVSNLHGAVTRKMWHALWPQTEEDEVPISQITNGVHLPSWIAPEMARLYDKYLGGNWLEIHDDICLWDKILEIPDEELWAARQTLKRKLLYTIVEHAQRGWVEGRLSAEQLPAMGTLLHPGILTIGFVRRFAEYKRPALIFEDIERLKKIVTSPHKPVQIIFAGKSHPADFPSKLLLHQVYSTAKDRAFEGRIAFVEDYDIHMARYLVQGVDVWLNTPRRLQEACGTSGMKAALNGVLHLSVHDGWWHEAYSGINGWAIGDGTAIYEPSEEDRMDFEALYDLLEKEIIPLHYDLDYKSVPHGWIKVIKETIRSIVPRYCARRMMKEYTEHMYIPAALSAQSRSQPT